jgi:uncharacterized protein YndB with AHSA1/START domain
VRSSQFETLISARPSTVWDILTDTCNVAVWESGITAIDGDMRDGGTIRIMMNGNERGGLRMRVQQLPGEVMRWEASLPLGLLQRTFTVSLSPEAGQTHLRIRHELGGFLSPFAGETLPASLDSLETFVEAVRKRAELLDRHLP